MATLEQRQALKEAATRTLDKDNSGSRGFYYTCAEPQIILSLLAELEATEKDAERMKFLHSYNKDADGFEWGVVKIRFDSDGKLQQCFFGLADPIAWLDFHGTGRVVSYEVQGYIPLYAAPEAFTDEL